MGSFWIVIAALLWATDALVRVRSLEALSPLFVVWWEHLLILAVLGIAAPVLWRISPRNWQALKLKDAKLQFLSFLVGAGGSALATVLFTAAFQSAHPTLVILLQKLQPVFVVIMARAFLGERPHKLFYLWASVALAAAVALQFAEPQSSFAGPSLQGALLAVGAAVLWAASTVAGRTLLLKKPVHTVTVWRFFWGALALTAAILALPGERQAIPAALASLASDPQLLASVTYMSIGPGLIAMGAYYLGLASTPASRVTILELVFPVCAILLNAVFLDAHLNGLQWVAGAVLIGAVTQIRHT